jgi:NAD(P)H dehydrogenase (quinone)
MILVTGAAGKTGRALIDALRVRGEEVRAVVHRPEQARPVQQLGAREVMVGDMRDPGTMKRATLRVRAVYHICPNVSPDEVAIGQAAIDAACSAGVERFIFHSVLHPQTEDMPHHWHKMRVEELLFKSGLAFTILQPTMYMQNLLAQWRNILDQNVYTIPYSAESRLSLVDLADVAEAAAIVLRETGHAGATYELVGTPAMSQNQVAGVLSQELGRAVRVTVVARDVWRAESSVAGLGPYQMDTLVKMFEYYEAYGLEGNPAVLGWLLGRRPTSFADFVRRSA